jgi:hypothetical protein
VVIGELIQSARALALALLEASAQDHHGRPSFRVAGKIFATLCDEHHMNVMLDEPGIHTAVQGRPEACAELWWGKRLSAVQVDLDHVDPNELRHLLADAWEGKAPRRLVDKITGQLCGSGARAHTRWPDAETRPGLEN